MTMILIDGFDHGDHADVWTGQSIIQSNSPMSPRTGTRFASTGASTSGVFHYRALAAAEVDDGVTMGIAVWVGSNFGGFGGGVGGPKIIFAEDLVNHVSAQFRSDTRTIELWRGTPSSGTKLAFTDTNIFTFNTWHYLELGAKIADSGGLAEVRLNGVAVLTYAGDTRNGGTTGIINRMGFQGVNDVGSAQTIGFDDVYMLNEQGSAPWASFLGDTRCFPLYPNGNGNYSQLVGSDGNSTNNYQLVDEPTTPASADYVGSVTDGEKDTYTFEDLPVTVGTIQAVETRMYAAKTETGTKQMRVVVRRSGADHELGDHVLAENSYATYRDIMQLDPHAGPGAWSITNVNGTELGVEVRA